MACCDSGKTSYKPLAKLEGKSPESCVQSTFGIVKNLHTYVDIPSENLKVKTVSVKAKRMAFEGM